MTDEAREVLAQLQSLHWTDRLEVAKTFMDSLVRDFRVVKEATLHCSKCSRKIAQVYHDHVK